MKQKTEFICAECGYATPKWYGKCPSCGEWNTFVEEQKEQPRKPSQKSAETIIQKTKSDAFPISGVLLPDHIRIQTGIGEFDRALGGGIVSGSVVLISGEPGIGKSTLLLQICGLLGADNKLLYVSGEESPQQIKLRAKRLGVTSKNLMILAQTDMNDIQAEIDLLSPSVVVIDSIQTMYDSSSSSSAGTVTQVKNAAAELIRVAKGSGIAVLIVGHVNKEGAIAGPKVLEHMVDTVLYFEGDRQHSYRILRAVKNRFGSTNEIGIFEMEDKGLIGVDNPSEYLLSQRPVNVSGNCTFCVMEGTRPILAEIQALVTPTVYPSPKRMATGFDYNRMSLIAAVLEKRMGLRFSSNDVYLNVVGGLHIDEPASDLATAFALISGLKDIPIDEGLVAMGEIGLSGECRSVSSIEQRVKECARLGFQKIVIPHRNFLKMNRKISDGAEIIAVKSIFDALNLFST